MMKFKNQNLIKIISIALIHTFLFTGILYPDSNSPDNKDIASICEPDMKLRVPMANSKGKKEYFTESFLQALTQEGLEPEENIFTETVFNTVCYQEKTGMRERENMFLIKLADVPPEKRDVMLNAARQWSISDHKKRQSKHILGLWKASVGWKMENYPFSILPPYLIFDKNYRLVAMVDCVLIDADSGLKKDFYWPEGMSLNQIVIAPELRKRKYPGMAVIYPELEEDIFIMVLKEAVNRGLAFNIDTYSSRGIIEGLLNHYGVEYKKGNYGYIEISAVEAKRKYKKILNKKYSSKLNLSPQKRGFANI
jgi:hypothetical protein